MKYRFALFLFLALALLAASPAGADERLLPQDWDYAAAMKQVAARGRGRPGVVLHVGDSITYSNPYGQWARAGAGQTADDKAALAWMHAGKDDDTDGWWLARFDHPDGGRSYTACSGLRADELLAGGRRNLPSLADLLKTYRPQVVVLRVGTNDATAGRSVAAYRADVGRAVDTVLGQGAVCVLSTLPPHPARPALARQYNAALRELARERRLPLIDYEREILTRRPDDWNGTLLNKDDVHPSVGRGEVNAASAPTAENLRESGYLLLGWLTVRKLAEVRQLVFDDKPSAPTAEATPPAARPPEGEAVKVPVTRDTWFSDVGAEADANLGGASRLKVKSYQEMSLVDVDPAALKGRVARAAALHLRLAGPERLHRVTVGSFGAEWVEGTSPDYTPQPGSSSFNRRRHPDVPWSYPGSDLCSVILGQGGTLWRTADAAPPDADGWQRVPVDPAVIAARVAGVSHGFLVFDDTGSEWARDGERFTVRQFPNRFVHSREAGAANAPYFTVHLGPEDRAPPAAPTGLTSDPAGLPAGEALVSWVTPKDEGPAGTVGFFVRVNGQDVPRHLIPLAGRPGERVRMRLRDLDLPAGGEAAFAVRAVDGAGNVGPALEGTARLSGYKPAALPGEAPAPLRGTGPLPRVGGAQVAVLDELDKVQPVTGEMIPPQPSVYLAANHLWSASDRRVRLHAARNEFVAFQILVNGRVEGLRPVLQFADDGAAGVRVAWGRYAHVPSAKGPLPDPILPLGRGLDVPAADDRIPGQKSGSIHGELYVPHDAAPGEHRGTLALAAGGETLELAVTLRVWDVTLPDYLSFLPEMNCYGLPGNEWAYYRQAHRHRTVLNRVPYHQDGRVAPGCAPGWDGARLSWAAWDGRFGPLLDGSAFRDLPRAGVPLECFYLPLHENWPEPMAGNFNGGYWADRAFPASYRRAFAEASRQFAEHFGERGWHDTLFQCFLNNKSGFKERGWSRGSSPWVLDEPMHFQDFWALRYFAVAFHEGVARAPGGARMVFRADVSRPQWQRTALDGLLDYNVVSASFRPYRRMVLDRKAADGELVIEYGGTNKVEDANVQPAGWCVDAWALGADGVLPWQTVGNAESWRKADELALFYPTRGEEVVPSVRLKAYRRGQQDVEYLTLLGQWTKEPRWAVGQRVREALGLAAERRATGAGGAEDAGLLHYGQLKPQDLWALRVRVGEVLSGAGLAPRRRLVDLRTPPRDPSRLEPCYVSGADVPAAAAEAPREPGVTKVLQGRAVTRDALLDPSRPGEAVGSAPRDNALTKREESAAYLVRFDLDRLGLPSGARVARATLSFYVWDPSSRGDTKVCAFPLKTAWDEVEASWRRPAAGQSWRGGGSFRLADDAGPAGPPVVVKPDQGSDTVDPPLEYRLDVTDAVRAWLEGRRPNHGVAVVPVPDRAVDEGYQTRFQFYGAKADRPQNAPKLTLELRP
jgi:hypothetical protein